MATQGKYRWRVGGVTGEDEPALAGAFFLGPPLVLADDLYVLAEIRGDISLFVLDSQTGQLRWSQQLAHVGQSNILVDSVRRLAGAAPSYSDGVLICPTSSGAVVAVDLANRSLLWGFEYPRTIARPVYGAIALNGLRISTSAAEREPWSDATVTLANGRAILTPAEANTVYCLDLLTGKLLWQQPRPEAAQYVGGVEDGKLIVIGRQDIRALHLSDGETAWTLPWPNETGGSASAVVPSGRGFLSDGCYFLPMTEQLLQVDLRDGQLVQSVPSSEPLGNLICNGDQILSLGPDFLSAFYRTDRLQQLVQSRLQQAPEDPWALEHQALLWLEEGRREDALRVLRQAVAQYDPRDDRRESARVLLVDVLLDSLERNFAENERLAEEVDGLIQRPRKREKYLRLLARTTASRPSAGGVRDVPGAVTESIPNGIRSIHTLRSPLVAGDGGSGPTRTARAVRPGGN